MKGRNALWPIGMAAARGMGCGMKIVVGDKRIQHVQAACAAPVTQLKRPPFSRQGIPDRCRRMGPEPGYPIR